MVNVGEAAAARDLLEGQIRAYEEILGVLDAEMKEISVRRHSEALAEDAGESLLRKPRSRGHLGHGDRLGDVRGQVVRDPFQGVRMPARRRVVAVELLEETQDDSRCQVLRLEVSEERSLLPDIDHLEHGVAQNGRLRRLELHREIDPENLTKRGCASCRCSERSVSPGRVTNVSWREGL